MILQDRIELLSKLGNYMMNDEPGWSEAKAKASKENGWFIPEFIELAIKNIASQFLKKESLENFARNYQLKDSNSRPKTIGIVMAGNIPLVGFHDLLCVFITGNKALIKPSSKDETLIKHLADGMIKWEPEVSDLIQFSDMLKNCDA